MPKLVIRQLRPVLHIPGLNKDTQVQHSGADIFQEPSDAGVEGILMPGPAIQTDALIGQVCL